MLYLVTVPKLNSKNKSIVISAIFSIFFLIAIIILYNFFLLEKKPQQNSETPTIPEIASSNSFPLETGPESEYLYFFPCTVDEVQDVNIKHTFGANQHDFIIFKLLTKCSYIDFNGQNQQAWVSMGAVIQNTEGYFFTYADRFWPLPIENEPLYTGTIMRDRIEKHAQEFKNFDPNSELDAGDIIEIAIAEHENTLMTNSMKEELLANSEKAYYGSGYTKSWNINDLRSFIETGNTEYLPELNDGRKIIPAVRATYAKNN